MVSRSDSSRHQTQVRWQLGKKWSGMLTFEEKLARYPFAAVRLDASGRVLETCPHDHGRREAEAIARARELGWDGLAELLVTEDAPSRPNDVWRFWTHGTETRLKNVGLDANAGAVLARRAR